MITLKMCLNQTDLENEDEKEYNIPESITYYYKGEETVAGFDFDQQAYVDREFYLSARDYVKNKLSNLTRNKEKKDGFSK